jgi:hypothetical protein
MSDVGEKAAELYHVGKARSGRGERRLEIREHLLGLRAEVRAREPAVGRGAELARDVDHTDCARDLDHLGVGRRWHQAFGIDVAGRGGHGVLHKFWAAQGQHSGGTAGSPL